MPENINNYLQLTLSPKQHSQCPQQGSSIVSLDTVSLTWQKAALFSIIIYLLFLPNLLIMTEKKKNSPWRHFSATVHDNGLLVRIFSSILSVVTTLSISFLPKGSDCCLLFIVYKEQFIIKFFVVSFCPNQT